MLIAILILVIGLQNTTAVILNGIRIIAENHVGYVHQPLRRQFLLQLLLRSQLLQQLKRTEVLIVIVYHLLYG